jgi:ferredoxin, 2Fe-2S
MKIVNVRVTDRDGITHALEGLAGWRLMEVIRDHGLPMKAECGGACSCATCHVYVDALWVGALPLKREEENERLDDAFDVDDTSRLSCQIILDSALEGLHVTLAAGIEP